MAIPLLGVGLISVIVGGVAKAFLFVMAFFVFRLLALIGFSYITYQGLDYLGDWFFNKIKDQITQLPEFIVSSLSIAKFDVALSIIFSAYVLRMSIRTASKITLFG